MSRVKTQQSQITVAYLTVNEPAPICKLNNKRRHAIRADHEGSGDSKCVTGLWWDVFNPCIQYHEQLSLIPVSGSALAS